VRKGPFGVAALNQIVENVLGRLGCIQWLPMQADQWYPGRPVMLKRNDYHRNLFNGDVGIAMADNGDPSSIRVAFMEAGGGLQWLTPEQLPAHETVYAMTVHKSQGTEFNKVVLVLPDTDVPLLTRELIYTAVTRARRHVEIWGNPDILIAAVERRIHRASGLRQALWPFK
jgi:exodeoxyribonuclease V alpha subunit